MRRVPPVFTDEYTQFQCTTLFVSAACLNGVEFDCENVCGDDTSALLLFLSYRARMRFYGLIAYYGIGRENPGPDHLPGFMRTIMSKGREVRGLGGAMVGGTAALEQLGTWVRDEIGRAHV